MQEKNGPRPLIVGELNPYGSSPGFALYPLPEHASGGRLARILGLGPRRYLEAFDRANLCAGAWSTAAARAEAARISAEHHGPLVLLGRRVATAFGMGRQEIPSVQGARALIPHPSGLCRAWNDPQMVGTVRGIVSRVTGVELPAADEPGLFG